MKIRSLRFMIYLYLVSCFLAFSAPVGAMVLDPTKLGLGARSVSMGRCAATLLGDPNSAFINPANAAEADRWGISSMYVNLSDDIVYTQLGGIMPEEWGTIGVSYLGSSSGGIIGTTVEAGRILPSGFTFDYSSSVISLIYGKKYNEELSFGATLKMFSKSFTSVASGNGFDLDLGVLWKPNERLKVGLAQQNTLPFSIAKMTWDTKHEEGIPFNTKLGVSYLMHYLEPDDILLTADLDYSQINPMLFHGGVEWATPYKFLKLRGGFDQYPENKETAVTNFTLGVGLLMGGMGFDYAYYADSLLPSSTAHYFSFRYEPPTVPEVVEAKKALGVELKEEEKMEEPPKPAIVFKTFYDVPKGSFARKEISYLATAGIISGYPDGGFKPANKLTRAEMAKLLVTLAGKSSEQFYYSGVFKDVPRGRWYTPYVLKAYEEGWISGYPDGTFKPNKTLSRAEAIALAVKFDGLELPAYVSRPPFPDVPLSSWAAPYIQEAKNAGWLKYLEGRNFSPNQGFTRMEAAYLLIRTKAGRQVAYDLVKGGVSE